MDTSLVISIVGFVAILAVLVLLRLRNKSFEIKTTDLVVAAFPVIVFLLVTGKLQKFELSESGLKIESAFVAASASSISSQVTPLRGLPTEPIQIDAKGGVGDIPKLLSKKTEGLLFRLGSGGYYYGPAIREYLSELTREPFLKYLIIENADGTFFGLSNARELASWLQNNQSPVSANDLAKWLNESNTASLTKLPGFIGAADAVNAEIDKKNALALMEKLDSDILPVLTDQKRYSGMVNRSRLTASLLVDVAEQMNK